MSSARSKNEGLEPDLRGLSRFVVPLGEHRHDCQRNVRLGLIAIVAIASGAWVWPEAKCCLQASALRLLEMFEFLQLLAVDILAIGLN